MVCQLRRGLLPSSVLIQLGWTELALLSLYPSDPAGRSSDPEKYTNLLKTGLVWFAWYDIILDYEFNHLSI